MPRSLRHERMKHRRFHRPASDCLYRRPVSRREPPAQSVLHAFGIVEKQPRPLAGGSTTGGRPLDGSKEPNRTSAPPELPRRTTGLVGSGRPLRLGRTRHPIPARIRRPCATTPGRARTTGPLPDRARGLSQNVLFAPGLTPAVVEVSPYWRPPAFADGPNLHEEADRYARAGAAIGV